MRSSVFTRFNFTALLFAIASTTAAAGTVNAFLDNYCLECHDTLMEEGDREFETFTLPLKNEPDLITAKDIIDQITLKEMPPKKADYHPTDEERLEVVRELRQAVLDARSLFESTG